MNLIESPIDRQNVLNNLEVVENIQKFLGIRGVFYDGEYRFTVAQIAYFMKQVLEL